jgi:hypothetical protein
MLTILRNLISLLFAAFSLILITLAFIALYRNSGKPVLSQVRMLTTYLLSFFISSLIAAIAYIPSQILTVIICQIFILCTVIVAFLINRITIFILNSHSRYKDHL